MPVFYPITSEGLDKYMLEKGSVDIIDGNVGRVALLKKNVTSHVAKSKEWHV